MVICFVFTLDSPHRGDSNEYTQYILFNIKKKITLNYSKSAVMGFFPRDSRKSSKTAVVNARSVFEPLRFYCIWNFKINLRRETNTPGPG